MLTLRTCRRSLVVGWNTKDSLMSSRILNRDFEDMKGRVATEKFWDIQPAWALRSKKIWSGGAGRVASVEMEDSMSITS
jgi:hypothetical protein